MARSLLSISAKLGAAALGLGLAFGGAPAKADPFTFDPSATTPQISTAGPFTADDIIYSQYGAININTGTATFSESGILKFSSFQLAGVTVFPAGFNGFPGATPYGLYIAFTATGTTPVTPGGGTGTFSTVTATLFADVGNDNGAITVTTTGATFAGGTGNDVQLTTGATVLLPGSTTSLGGTTTRPQPNAELIVRLTNTTAGDVFMVLPIGLQFDLDSSFTTTGSVVTRVGTPTGFVLEIRGGAGNGTISAVAAPEPASLALLGSAMLGIGLLRARRKRS